MMHFACPRRDVLRAVALVFAFGFVLFGVPPFARAQEGGAPPPPPAEPPPAETAAPVEPQSLQPAAPAPAPPSTPANRVAPGRRGAAAFTWGDSTGLVLPPLADVRTPAELDADYVAWQTMRTNSENRMLKSRERSVRWKSQVEIQKSQINVIGKQIDAAKKEKREADKKDGEAAKKREEKKRDYYDTMRQVMEAAADQQKAQFDLAGARMTTIEQEKKLHEMWSRGGYDARVSSDSRAQETRVLNLVKVDADLLANLASKERVLADKGLNALKLWGDLQK